MSDAPRSSPTATLGVFQPARMVLPQSGGGDDDDETSILPRFNRAESVHDEPTKIGALPVEALMAERLFAQRTEPPPPAPASDAAPSAPVPSLQQLAEEANRGAPEPVSEAQIEVVVSDSKLEAAPAEPAPASVPEPIAPPSSTEQTTEGAPVKVDVALTEHDTAEVARLRPQTLWMVVGVLVVIVALVFAWIVAS